MKKISRLFLSFIVFALVLTGCSSKGGAGEDSTYDPDSTVEITWLNMLHTASTPNDVIKTELEARTNAKITFNWVPDASKEERITTALASQVLGEIVTLTQINNSSVRNALKSEMFWDVEEYLSEFPNLKNISEDRIASAKVGGKLYGVPFQKALTRSGFVMRQDWLDNLGLKVPTNLDELMEVARAFTEDDPDGNGVNDTVAFGDRSDLRYGSFKLLSSYHGTPNGWAVDDKGKFTPEFETKEYKETLNYSRTLFEKGYLFQDFAVTAKAEQQQQFAQGKTGIYTGMIDITNLRNASQGLQEGLALVPVNKISKDAKSSDVTIWSEGNGVNGLLAFPKSYVKTEGELRRLLKFVDDLMTEDNYMLLTLGIEGVHYEMGADGVAKKLDNDLWKAEVQPFSSSRPSEIAFDLKDSNPEKEFANELIRENDAFAVLNPALLLDSATFNEVGTELEKLITDATFKYIMGQIDEAGFDSAVAEWRRQGGDKIVAEYEADYASMK